MNGMLTITCFKGVVFMGLLYDSAKYEEANVCVGPELRQSGSSVFSNLVNPPSNPVRRDLVKFWQPQIPSHLTHSEREQYTTQERQRVDVREERKPRSSGCLLRYKSITKHVAKKFLLVKHWTSVFSRVIQPKFSKTCIQNHKTYHREDPCRAL